MSVEDIIQERKNTHGPYPTMASCAQAIKDILDHFRLTRQNHVHKEALDLIATKLARIATGDADEVDHWDDIAGYATLVANELRKEKKS